MVDSSKIGHESTELRVTVRDQIERLSLFIALLLVLLTGIFTYRAWAAFERARQEALITRNVVDETAVLLSSVHDAEIGQRGFLLTGDDGYLEAYREALKRIPASWDALVRAETARHDARQLQRLDALKPLLAEKLDALAQTIAIRRSQGLDAAIAIVRSDRGKAAMERIRALCGEIRAAAYDLLERQRREVRTSSYEAGLIGTLGSVATFLLLVLAAVTVREGTRHRQRLIADLQRSDERARTARDFLQTTISSIGEGVISTDAAGMVVFMNPVAQSLTGVTQAQAAGKPLHEVFKITDEETGLVAGGAAGHSLLTAGDGRRIPIEKSAAPIRVEGVVTGTVLVFRDITQRREAERAREKADADLIRQAELLQRTNTELRNFGYAASHDLREPLRTITACTELVQLRASQLDQKSAESLQYVVEAAARMGRLLDALLDYSKAGEMTNRPQSVLPMEEVLKSALGSLNGAVVENDAVITHDPLPSIVGDRIHLEQLMQNLIGNALKYRREEAPRVHVAARKSSGEWLFSVSDNGQGIPAGQHLEIFELFKRLHGRQYPGAGIGLATCKRLVERYGGRIWVESETATGSTFYFTMPDGLGPDLADIDA